MDDFERSLRADRLFAACGRALTVATRFEAGCRAVFTMAGIAADPALLFSGPDRMLEFASAISRGPLAKYLTRLGAAFKDQEITAVFEAARTARNDVAHELTRGLDYSLSDGDEQETVLARLQRLMPPLAQADTIVSILLSQLSGEPLPTFLQDYARLVADWVYELEPRQPPN